MFRFLCWDLHSLKAGQIVEVNISTAVNVKLLTYNNFSQYKFGLIYHFIGGFARNTPVKIEVPYDNNWVLVVDLTEPHAAIFGGIMKVNGVKIITPVSENKTTDEDITNQQQEATAKEEIGCYDIFLSHASEDKDTIAMPLYTELKRDLKVWIDVDKADDLSKRGLRREIDSAIYNSKYAVIILSPDFIRKPWTKREFDGITAMEMAEKQKLICIWHNVNHQEVLEFSPPLANKLAIKTAEFSIDQIAEKIKSKITS